MTTVDVRSRGFSLTPALRAHVMRRLSFALDRHAHRARRVRVVLADVNGTRGGVDKACRIDVLLNGGRTVRATVLDRDVYAAIDVAAARAARGVAKAAERERTALLELLWIARTMSRRRTRMA